MFSETHMDKSKRVMGTPFALARALCKAFSASATRSPSDRLNISELSEMYCLWAPPVAGLSLGEEAPNSRPMGLAESSSNDIEPTVVFLAALTAFSAAAMSRAVARRCA